MKVFVVVILFFTSSMACALVTEDKCPNVDMSAKFGRIRNQHSDPQCYAYVAADLIGYYQGLTPDKQISAVDVTSNNLSITPDELRQHVFQANGNLRLSGNQLIADKALKEDGASLEERLKTGGIVQFAIAGYNRRQGSCTEDQLPSEVSAPKKEERNYLSKQVFALADEGIVDNAKLKLKPILSRSVLLSAQKSEVRNLNLCPPGDPLKRVLNFGEEINNNMVRDLDKAVDKACSPRAPMKPMMARKTQVANGPNPIYPVMLAAGMRRGIPVMISYDESFLTKGSRVPFKSEGHASIVVGSRWNGASCEFKIRNSWGSSCDIYAPEYRARCEGGNIWVTEADLAKRVGSITYIEN